MHMSATKTFRHGQILRVIAQGGVGSQEELRRRLAQQKLRVTQATLSRDLHELKLAKTLEGYKPSRGLPTMPLRFLPSLAPFANFFWIFARPKICSFSRLLPAARSPWLLLLMVRNFQKLPAPSLATTPSSSSLPIAKPANPCRKKSKLR